MGVEASLQHAHGELEKKDGRVTGCIAVDGDGKYVRYNAKKGVVIATGGYALNYKMLEALQPHTLRVIGRNRSMPGAHGDGIKALGRRQDGRNARLDEVRPLRSAS